MALEDVDTPALLLDLDAFEFNIQLMAGFAEKFKINHRPHAKTHKSPVVAQKQIVAGAVGPATRCGAALKGMMNALVRQRPSH